MVNKMYHIILIYQSDSMFRNLPTHSIEYHIKFHDIKFNSCFSKLYGELSCSDNGGRLLVSDRQSSITIGLEVR